MGLVVDATQNKLTYQIIGAAMAVHNELGAGFKENVYEKALYHKLRSLDISVVRQYPVEVVFEGEPVAQLYLDLFVEEKVVVELKAFRHSLTYAELTQVIKYLKATGAPVGLLFNFGRSKLEYRRVFPGGANARE